ncbi:MAG: hypothetical protein F6J96_10235 [Symploca sp. SIO1C2]|nr:hypothetical protein [Symploca sp. SIO1C2]
MKKQYTEILNLPGVIVKSKKEIENIRFVLKRVALTLRRKLRAKTKAKESSVLL